MEKEIARSYETLHWTYGLVPIVAGLDKFTGVLADWEGYLSPRAARLLPVQPKTFMKWVGLIEIGAGLSVLAKPRFGAWITSAWLLSIAANLVDARRYDIAVRDVVMAIGAGTLAQMAHMMEQERGRTASLREPSSPSFAPPQRFARQRAEGPGRREPYQPSAPTPVYQ